MAHHASCDHLDYRQPWPYWAYCKYYESHASLVRLVGKEDCSMSTFPGISKQARGIARLYKWLGLYSIPLLTIVTY